MACSWCKCHRSSAPLCPHSSRALSSRNTQSWGHNQQEFRPLGQTQSRTARHLGPLRSWRLRPGRDSPAAAAQKVWRVARAVRAVREQLEEGEVGGRHHSPSHNDRTSDSRSGREVCVHTEHHAHLEPCNPVHIVRRLWCPVQQSPPPGRAGSTTSSAVLHS